MYKFHLNNTKRTSSKARCAHVLLLSLGRNTFLRGQDFSFYCMFKTNFFGCNIIGEHPPECPPWLHAYLQSKRFTLGRKYCCIMLLVRFK